MYLFKKIKIKLKIKLKISYQFMTCKTVWGFTALIIQNIQILSLYNHRYKKTKNVNLILFLWSRKLAEEH